MARQNGLSRAERLRDLKEAKAIVLRLRRRSPPATSCENIDKLKPLLDAAGCFERERYTLVRTYDFAQRSAGSHREA
jgi:hypothetical protein